MISYQLPEPADVRLVVYDILGRRVKTLVDEAQQAGYYSVAWEGRDDSGKKMGTGIYLYKMEANDFVQTKKMALIR